MFNAQFLVFQLHIHRFYSPSSPVRSPPRPLSAPPPPPHAASSSRAPSLSQAWRSLTATVCPPHAPCGSAASTEDTTAASSPGTADLSNGGSGSGRSLRVALPPAVAPDPSSAIDPRSEEGGAATLAAAARRRLRAWTHITPNPTRICCRCRKKSDGSPWFCKNHHFEFKIPRFDYIIPRFEIQNSSFLLTTTQVARAVRPPRYFNAKVTHF